MKTLISRIWTSEAAGVGLIASLMLLGVQLASPGHHIDVPTVLLPFATGLGIEPLGKLIPTPGSGQEETPPT